MNDDTTPDANDPIERLHESASDKMDRSCPPSHLSRDNLEWLSQQDIGMDHAIRLYRLQHDHPRIHAETVAACRDANRRPVLAALLHNDGRATYDELAVYASCSGRTIRRHIDALEDAGIVTRQHSRPVIVSFASEAAELLTNDALSRHYAQE